MAPSPGRFGHAGGPARPVAFLISTTPVARSISENLGSPAYSYYFVMEALAPALEGLGTWRWVDRPESRLSFAARRARADGFDPVHLALVPPQDAYFAADVPNVLYPFWEFPEIPDRDFGFDTRQNWRRMCRGADLILTACRFTAEAFRAAGVECPIEMVPVPADGARSDLPDWDPGAAFTLTCRHEVWGGDAGRGQGVEPESGPTTLEIGGDRRPRGWDLARRGFRRVAPWMDPELVSRVYRLKRSLAGKSPGRLAYLAARGAYNRTLRRVLNESTVRRITEAKVSVLRALGHSPAVAFDPLLPSAPVTFTGLTYTTFLNIGDRRKNLDDILSAFLLAFRDRRDVTLVLKLASNPSREFHEMAILRGRYRDLGIDHACRVVVIPDYLDDRAMDALARVTTYYVNASHAEGACLPLQQALASGRPAIAPAHTAMADYMDDGIGFVVGSHPEPTHWPHDPEERIETTRHRIVWTDLRDAFLESAALPTDDPGRYRSMSLVARGRMAGLASTPVAVEALRRAMGRLAGRASLESRRRSA